MTFSRRSLVLSRPCPNYLRSFTSLAQKLAV